MPARAYRFGTFRLDIDKRELWRADRCVSLQPKVFDCLAYLVEHRDAAVSRDELIGAAWGRADVTDNVLGQIIARARHAVDDTGEDQRVIRTVVRFGYRWVAAVEAIAEATELVRAVELPVVGEPAAPAVDAAVPATEASPPDVVERIEPRRRLPRHVPAIWIVGAVVVGVAGWAVLRVHPTGAPPPSARAVDGAAVILPVTVLAAGDFAWIRLGVMDLVAERLREAGQPVMPSDSVVAWAHNFADRSPGAEDITELAETVGARWVTQARAELVGDRWRVSLHTLYGPALTTEGEDRDVLVAARSPIHACASSRARCACTGWPPAVT